ncbi:hypothetical protein [Aeromicrobium sp.]|uniref:hypothetical protein n=1 Tax=Aeromicrobium sp. TaxID=1871063 RepID=UPI0030C0B054
MSDSNGPVRRRRIAGESKPAAPAKKAPAKRPAVKKAPVKKSGAKQAPTEQAPVTKAGARQTRAKQAPTEQAPVTKTGARQTRAKQAPATRTPAKKSGAKRANPPEAPVKDAVATPTSATQDSAARSTTTAKVVRPPRPTPKTPVARPSTDSSDGSGTGTRRDLRLLIPAFLVALAAIVAGVLLTVNGVSHVRDGGGGGGQGITTSQEQASSAAGSAAETIFSFRFDELDEHLSSSKALMTPRFAKEFDKIAPALTELAPQRKIVVQAVTRNAAVLGCGDECSATKANVLVFVDQARLVGGSKQPTVFANRISVSMVKTDDGWLVNNIRAL